MAGDLRGWKPLCLTGTITWICALVLRFLASSFPLFAESYARWVYPLLVGSLGMLFSLLPFSVAEALLYSGILALAIWLVISLLRLIRGRVQGRSCSRGLILGKCLAVLLGWSGMLALVYMLGCGINYHRQTFSQREGLTIADSQREELVALCEELVREVNLSAEKLSLRDDGTWRLSAEAPMKARTAMEQLGEKYTSLDGSYPSPKGVLISRWLSLQQITGIYSPFTFEANYNREVPGYEKVFSICHELSHLKGFMREDEANFVAWLACMSSEDPELHYSGALSGFVYAGNALYRYDKERYSELRGQLCDTANRDLREVTLFWKQYDGKVAETHEKVNDVYLKANAQTDGVESYGRIVDLMLAYRRGDSD